MSTAAKKKETTTEEILAYISSKGWTLVLRGYSDWYLEKDGIRLRMSTSNATLSVSSFQLIIQVHEWANEGDAETRLDFITYFISEADRRLGLLKARLEK